MEGNEYACSVSFPSLSVFYPSLPSINVFLPSGGRRGGLKRRTESFVEHVLLRKWICAGKRMCVCTFVGNMLRQNPGEGGAGKCSFLPSCFLPLKKYQRYIAQNFSSPLLALFFGKKARRCGSYTTRVSPAKKHERKRKDINLLFLPLFFFCPIMHQRQWLYPAF